MFKEIAVDPNAVAKSFRDLTYVVEKFGIPEGRLIARFPKQWRRMAYQAAEVQHRGTVELSRIQERLRRMNESAFIARHRPGDGCEADWLGSAVTEHGRLPFDGIIASVQRPEPFVVDLEQLDGNHPLLEPSRQKHVARVAADMADACGPLLTHARHVKLVDPHFDAGAPRFRNPFEAFLGKLPPGAQIDVFRGEGVDLATAVDRMDRVLLHRDMRGCRVRLFLRPQESMHNRFVLSELGGVSFGIGLDEDFGGDRPDDLVMLLEQGPWQVEWNRHTGDNPIRVWGDE
ncbi:hypothetical protein [Comamonas terrigena]|uniref:hypothetical protein n=1 Tax=Comamonas terrigena TaxID=32013 RepID=UPI0028B17F77|nr:hypothetical protein [Comamonas terrigena]